MNHFLPDDRLRRFLMLLFIVLAVIELSRASFVWGGGD